MNIYKKEDLCSEILYNLLEIKVFESSILDLGFFLR